MKVIILTQYFPPEVGAPQSRLYELALGLKDRNWDVSVITAMPNYPTGRIFGPYVGKWTAREFISGIEVKRYWLFPSNSRRAAPRILSMLSFSFISLFSFRYIRKKRPHYLFVESPPLLLGVSAWVLSRVSSARMILNVSDIWPLSAYELGAISRGRMYRILERLEHALYRKATLCLGQSQEIVDHIRLYQPHKAFLFRNGVDTSRFANHLSGGYARNHIVYLGLLGVAQGLFQLCQSVDFRQLGCELHLYGSGPELEPIRNYVTANPNRGIKYMGMVEREKVPEVLSGYGVALVPLVKNIYGAVPSKIYEMMAAGLPILYSGEGEAAELIVRFEAGWVSHPKDWTSLKINIDKFLSVNDLDYEKMRERNRRTASINFDRRKVIDELSTLLTNHNEPK